MIKGLVGQFNIIGKAALSSLAPALVRLGLVLLGLILGLVWAYQFAPVEFRDAEPVHLADGYKDQWIKMTATTYAESADRQDAAQKLVDGGVTPSMIQDLIDANQGADQALTADLQRLLEVAQENQSAAEDQADKVDAGFLSGLLGPILCVVSFAVIGLILVLVLTFYWAVPVGKWAKPRPQNITSGAPGGTVTSMGAGASGASFATQKQFRKQAEAQKTDFAAMGEAEPISRHTSTYILGDDLYDDSFSIETEDDEFLGECGSGISETIGVGDPKKVTATEVWLFDKNDIRTVTKVIMSEHAYNDQALRTKLAPKGEAVMATPGGIITLETQTLRVQVKIMDLQYGEGALPPNSFFERLIVEIAAWPKEASDDGDSGGGPGGNKPEPPETSAAFGDTEDLLSY